MNKAFFIVLFFFTLFSNEVYGDEISITVEAPSSAIIKEKFAVRYSINTPIDDEKISITDVKNIATVFGPAKSTSSQVSLTAGVRTETSTTSYAYYFTASANGTLNIPIITIKTKDGVYKSQPQTIDISGDEQDSGDIQASKKQEVNNWKGNSFIALNISKKEIFENETITITLSLYTDEEIVNINSFIIPSLDGFLIKEFDLPDDIKVVRTKIKGVSYNKVEIFKRELTPLYSGDLTIGEGIVDLIVNAPTGTTVPTFFGEQNVLEEKPKIIKSEAITIKVKPLPGSALPPDSLFDIIEHPIEETTIIEQVADDTTPTDDITHSGNRSILIGFLIAILIMLAIMYFVSKSRQKEKQKLNPEIKENQYRALQLGYIVGIVIVSGVLVWLLMFKYRPVASIEPQEESVVETVNPDASIAYVLDVSESMKIEDFRPNRLAAMQSSIAKHIAKSHPMNAGMVLFGKEQKLMFSPQKNKEIFIDTLNKIDSISINRDGTSMGTGIIVAINELTDYPKDKKYVIIFTDGDNNSGIIDPITTMQIAKSLGITVYIVGINTEKESTIESVDKQGKKTRRPAKTSINTDLLSKTARITNGEFFLVASNKELDDVFVKIEHHMQATSTDDTDGKLDEPLPFSHSEAKKILKRVMDKLGKQDEGK